MALHLDAGNWGWLPAPATASLLLAAGVSAARGFSLNVSNFYSTAAEEESYGNRIGRLLHLTSFDRLLAVPEVEPRWNGRGQHCWQVSRRLGQNQSACVATRG